MLKCESVHPQISAYLDREMPLWRVQLIQWHLKRCPTCAHEVMSLQQADKILGKLEPIKTSDSFLPDVMRHVSEIAVIEKRQLPLMRRILRKLEASLAWTRYSFRMRTSTYAVAFTLVLLVMLASIATTVYYPRRLSLSPEKNPILAQSPTKGLAIIPIEIIPVQPPKRHLPVDYESIEK